MDLEHVELENKYLQFLLHLELPLTHHMVDSGESEPVILQKNNNILYMKHMEKVITLK